MMEQHTPQARQLEFTGIGSEFFRIWIVNVGLTLVTLGIYSAWAKVRTKRYFYGNTLIDNSSFEYLASPITILKGRLISFAVIASYVLVTDFYPMATPVFLLAFVLIFPWLIVRSLCFNARNTAYRNVTFNFRGSTGQSYLCFLILPLLSVLTLGLAYPAVVARQKRYFVNNSCFGGSEFQLDAATRAFFWIYLKAFLVLLLAFAAVFGMSYYFALAAAGPTGADAGYAPFIPITISLIIYPAYLIAYTLVQANITNLVVNNSSLEGHHFASNLETGKLLWLYLSNSVAILLSLGLLIPWAMIRSARYRVECTALVTDQPLDNFIRVQQNQISATGEELSDLMDVEFGL